MNAIKAEQLLREMRERAIGQPEPTPVAQVDLEPLKKLYFHAGRWSGGARDWTARKAFEEMNRRERV